MTSYDVTFSGLHDRLEALRQEFDAALASLFTELDQAREAVAELKGAEDDQAGKLQQAEERIGAQDELIETLNQELQEAKRLRSEIRERELDIERMRSELSSKNELVSAVREQTNRATAQIGELQRELAEAREQSADATAMDNAEIVALKAELEARRSMIRNLREDAARAETLESQLDAKRETISMLEESIEQHVHTIADLRKSADAWKLKYMAVKGGPTADSEETLTQQPAFTDTEIEALREFDPNADTDSASDKTLSIDMRDVLEAVRAQKAQKAQKAQGGS
jgi:chromosome segregation ATPase